VEIEDNDPEYWLGGGSGGDAGMDTKGNQLHSATATYQIGGNQVVLVSRHNIPPQKSGPSRIIILAGGGLPGGFADDGTVDIRGAKGVRLTAGGLAVPLMSPDTSVGSTGGVEIAVDETQNVTIMRGMEPTDQWIQMTPTGISINAGPKGQLVLSAGMSSITISAAGIVIDGAPQTQINPGPPAPPPPPLPPDTPLPPLPPLPAAPLPPLPAPGPSLA
jgi:hypothetical protein